MVEEKTIEEKLIEEIMGDVFRRFEYSEYSNHKLFRNYKILKTKDPKKFTYKIPSLDPGNRMRECTVGEKETNPIDKFEKIKAINVALAPSIINNNITNTANITKDLLENSKEILDLLSKEPAKYQHTLKIINSSIQCIEPKFQLKPVMALKEHLKENTIALVHASKVLMDNNLYEEVIELLEPKLLNITSVDNIIAQGMYNLGSSYMSIGNYNKAEQYLVNSSAGLPKDDLDLIMSLYDIYIVTYRIAEAKELLINISSKDIKDYLTLSLGIDKVTPKKLATINKKNLPFNLLQNYKYYEYIAKYNNYSNSEKEKQQKQLTNDFKKIISSTNVDKAFVLSVALYTKQNEIALDILKELPKVFFFLKHFLT